MDLLRWIYDLFSSNMSIEQENIFRIYLLLHKLKKHKYGIYKQVLFLSLIVAQNGSPTPEILCNKIEAALNQMKRCVFLIMRSKIYILFDILIFCTNCSMDLLLQYYLLSHVLHIQLHRYCHFHLLHKLQQGLKSSISFLTYLYHRIQSRLFHFE